jgi:hypothetical protein
VSNCLDQTSPFLCTGIEDLVAVAQNNWLVASRVETGMQPRGVCRRARILQRYRETENATRSCRRRMPEKTDAVKDFDG